VNAIQLLRSMHAETKVRFKVILGTVDGQVAGQDWVTLQPALKLHEELEDDFVYVPLQHEMGAGTPLGDWAVQHDADVDYVEQLIQQSADLAPGSPEWRMCIASIMDALSKHVMDEENQIFGRVEQIWSAARLEQVGAQMQARIGKPVQRKRSKKSTPSPVGRRR
jgi:hypothetical protein